MKKRIGDGIHGIHPWPLSGFRQSSLLALHSPRDLMLIRRNWVSSQSQRKLWKACLSSLSGRSRGSEQDGKKTIVIRQMLSENKYQEFTFNPNTPSSHPNTTNQKREEGHPSHISSSGSCTPATSTPPSPSTAGSGSGSSGIVRLTSSSSSASAPTSLQHYLTISWNNLFHYLYPKNYPQSVSKGYSDYVTWQMTSALFSSAASILSMQSLLSAIGIGQGMLPLAATLNWVLKDGLGQLGGIWFASLVNTRFDSEPKRWRFLAAISLELSCLLELMTPLFPGYFLPIASLANFGKNIAALATSASRAAIHISFAKEYNLADITAKTASQNILSSTCGTGLGLAVSYWIGSMAGGGGGGEGEVAVMAGKEFWNYFLAFSSLSSVSLWCQYQSLTHVTLNTLNLCRLDHIFGQSLNAVFHKNLHSSSSSSQRESIQLDSILSPSALRKYKEIYLGTTEEELALPKVIIGDDINNVFLDQSMFETINKAFKKEHYLLVVTTPSSLDKTSAKVHILFKSTASKRDLLLAHCHAYIARRLLHEEGYYSSEKKLLGSPLPSWLQGGKDLPATSVTESDTLRLDIIQASFEAMNRACRGVIVNHNQLVASSSDAMKSTTVGEVIIDQLLMGENDGHGHLQSGRGRQGSREEELNYWVVAVGLLEPRLARISTSS
eukprot:scaffold1190_cov187-Ochromonas_danica.AAC.14